MPKGKSRHIYKRGAVWWARLTIDGRKLRKSLRTSHEATAQRWAEEWRAQVIGKVKFGVDRKSYTDAVTEWSAHIVANVGGNTAKRYATSLRQMQAHLMPLFLDQIDREKVTEIVAARRKIGVSTATIRRDLSALSSLLTFHDTASNPALDRLKRLKERRDPITLPEPGDVDLVVASAPGNLAALIRAALLTGCRQDELVTAKRRSLDHQRRTLTVIGKGRKLRVLQLSDAAYDVLRAVPATLNSEWLFWHGEGEGYANVASRFAALTARAQKRTQGFRRFRFHDLRHRYAVDALRSGISIYDVQQHLGHSSLTTTELYLAFLTPEEQRGAKFQGTKEAQSVAV